MLKPDNHWTWFFDSDVQALALELGQVSPFHLNINPKHLIADAFEATPFSVEDAISFQLYSDAVSDLALPESQQIKLVLTAVAARKYHKPLLPKSWFFVSPPVHISPQVGELVTLHTEFGAGVFLLLENSGSASLCLLASEEPLSLTANKALCFAEPIKVMNDRLRPYHLDTELAPNRFYALVG